MNELEEIKKLVSSRVPEFPIEPLDVPELDKLEAKKSPDLFVKVDKYQDLINSFRDLKKILNDINDLLDVKAESTKLLKDNFKKFKDTISIIDHHLNVPQLERFVRKEEVRGAREYIESLQKEIARLKIEFESES